MIRGLTCRLEYTHKCVCIVLEHGSQQTNSLVECVGVEHSPDIVHRGEHCGKKLTNT